MNLSVTQNHKSDNTSSELTMEVTLSPKKTVNQVYEQLLAIEGIHQLDIK